MRQAFLLFALLLGAAACTQHRGLTGCAVGTVLVNGDCESIPFDAGTRGDAGALRDGGNDDAGQAGDAGNVLDGGELNDAGGPGDAGDAGNSSDAGPVDGGADAGTALSEATCVGFHPDHSYTQPDDRVASPLAPVWALDLADAGVSSASAFEVPAISRGLVLVKTGEWVAPPSQLQAFDLETGTRVWGPTRASPRLAVDNGRFFGMAGTSPIDTRIGAYDLATGAGPLWVSPILTGQQVFSPIVAAGGVVYINGKTSGGTSAGGTTYAINEQSGALQWRGDQSTGTLGAVSAANGVVYLAEDCGSVIAYAAATGQQLWHHPRECNYDVYTASTQLYRDLIFYTSGGALLMNTAGQDQPVFNWNAPLAVHNGTVFFVREERTLLAVDLETHATKWTFAPNGVWDMLTQPVIAGATGQIFVISQAGVLYELDEATGSIRSKFTYSATPSNATMLLAGNHLVLNVEKSIFVF
jgi:outer membrane protein assembly factor BamB